jgi:hypothetical protein
MRGESTEPAPGAGSPGVRESCIVLALCAAAAARVLVYALGFPVFDNLDEAPHFDLVLTYAHGRMPRALETIRPEAAPWIALYASPEYLSRPEQHPGGRYPPPLWAQPPDRAAAQLARDSAFWRTFTNPESLAPPFYYALAAGWLTLGRALFGFGPGSQPYWIRALDVPCAAALVWLAYATSRSVFPERRFVRIGVPALIALLPQDALYSIQSDVPSPLCFGAAFLAVLRFTESARPRAYLGAGIGLALAATALTKTSNLPLIAVVGVVVLADVRRRAAAGTLRVATPALAWLCACAALPFGIWLIRNQIVIGDFTGTADKIALMDWTRKPVGEWWPHPIFTPRGLGYFLRENTVTFWRGEFVWGGRRLASPAADAGYVLSTALCLAATALGLLPRFRRPARERRALGFAFASLLAPLLFLALLSVAFDFGNCWYPSRELPYFTSGRLVSGALVPFALLYVGGLDRWLGRVRAEWPRFAVLAVILVCMTVSEAAVNRVAFASAYNGFAVWSAP